MDNLDSILKDYINILNKNDQLDQDIRDTDKKIDKRIEVCIDTPKILIESEREFMQLTSIINKKDISFFIFSVILQGGVKYYIKKFRDMTDREIGDKTPFHGKEQSNRHNNKYYASKEEIISNPVPFDSIQKEHPNQWYKEKGIELPGFSGFNHRSTALGHDPLLGLVFGTANIMTSTITRNDFVSWHVNTMDHARTAKNGKEYFAYLDTICERANTLEIFKSISNRIQNEGTEGWITLGCALLKEIVHLLSDLPSRQGLPLPLLSTFSPKLARELSLYGLNFSTIVQGGIATSIINWLIGFLHGLCRSKNEDVELYKARTNKIIVYSDLFCTTSDLCYSLFTAYLGDKNTMRKFDLGSYLVTVNKIINSPKVLNEIENEFYTKIILQKLETT